MEDYARTALVRMLTTAVADSELAGVVGLQKING